MVFTPVPNYCEENVWHLATQESDNPRWAVFISTEDQNCVLWAQFSQYRESGPVVWDYHVILLERTAEGFIVLDPNCTLGYPISCEDWTYGNFPTPDFEVRFRLVESQEFLRDFRSDRRHMLDADGLVQSPPPWPPISAGESNLDTYTSVAANPPGVVLDLTAWIRFTCLTVD